MTQPKRPPAKPKPIGQHPHAGQLAFVIAGRVVPIRPRDDDPVLLRTGLEKAMGQIGTPWGVFRDLTVAVRVIGAGGEASEHEGVVGPLARTEDDVTVQRPPLRETIDPGDRL